MIKRIIDKRYSARTFCDKVISKQKTNYILHCALNAPSKQSIYPYKIYVLGNSKKAIKFKQWLFWHDTWCANGERSNTENKTPKNTRFNGQYNAPLLFLYAHRQPSNLTHIPIKQTNRAFKNETDLIDMTVSASFAMLAAEELGLRTCFGRCHSYEYIDTVLGEGSVKIGMALGMGYADSVDNDSEMITPIRDATGSLQGYDTNNLKQTYPIKNHNVRQNKPKIDNLFTFV